MLKAVAIANYRSLRHIVIRLQNLNVLTGANGSGKSSFYRALRLLADTAQGRVVPSLAREGGLQSTLWAGPESIARSVRRREYAVEGTRREKPVNLRLGFSSDDLGYLIDLGWTAMVQYIGFRFFRSVSASSSFSERAITNVATPLPMTLTAARNMLMKRSI